nr:hypothetical protein [Tanacetum cinerariifolium]
MSSWYEFNCYGCERPSDTPVCYLCTCEQCGNILSYGTCLNCNSGTGNSFTYDTISESFDEVQVIPDPPPQCHFNVYLCQICESNSHYGYECSQRVPLVYELEPCYIQNFSDNDYSHDFPSIPACCDDDDDHNSAITPNEPVLSLSMGDEHLNTISVTESDEFIKSCVENLVPNPSESDGENGCDSLSDEDFLEEIFSNPLFEEEIISTKIDPHHFNAESDLIESMLNHDSSIIHSSSKIDSFLDEFAGELTLLKSIPSGIVKTDCYPENEIRLTKRLLYDNSSPRPPEEFVSDNSDAEIEFFSPSPIPVKDSDSLMKEIDLSYTSDDPMPSGIEKDDDDSEMDMLILEELLDNYSLSFPVIESYHFDIPLFSRPSAKPPDGNTEILNVKMMGDISNQKVPIPGLTITLVLNQEKSPDLLSHRGFKTFQPFTECPMMIYGKNIPILDVPLFHFYPLDQLKYGGIGSSLVI